MGVMDNGQQPCRALWCFSMKPSLGDVLIVQFWHSAVETPCLKELLL